MSIEKERKAFDAWHLKQFKDINDDLNDDEAEHLYQRVYSHEAQDLIRQMEFNAWLSSANRQGYKLVPIKCTNNMAHAAKEIDGRLSAFKYGDVWEAMIGACDD